MSDRTWKSDGQGNVTEITVNASIQGLIDYIRASRYVPERFIVRDGDWRVEGDSLIVRFEKPTREQHGHD